MKLNDSLGRIEEIISAILLAIMTVLISLQVFNRYVLNDSLVWTEELSQYIFIAAVYIGCGYGMKEDQHYAITFIRNYCGPRSRKIVMGLTYTLTIVFCLICVIYGYQMIKLLSITGQNTPALGIRMYWPYLAIPVGMGFMAYRAASHLWRTILEK